jgi:hypothetical protein
MYCCYRLSSTTRLPKQATKGPGKLKFSLGQAQRAGKLKFSLGNMVMFITPVVGTMSKRVKNLRTHGHGNFSIINNHYNNIAIELFILPLADQPKVCSGCSDPYKNILVNIFFRKTSEFLHIKPQYFPPQGNILQ